MTHTKRPVPEGIEAYTVFPSEGTAEEAFRDLRNAFLDIFLPILDVTRDFLLRAQEAIDLIEASNSQKEAPVKKETIEDCEVYWRPTDDPEADWLPLGTITDSNLTINEKESQP